MAEIIVAIVGGIAILFMLFDIVTKLDWIGYHRQVEDLRLVDDADRQQQAHLRGDPYGVHGNFPPAL